MDNFKQATKKEVSEFKKLVGKNIQFFRNAKNLSQDKLSEILNISTSSLGYIEVGKSQPRVENLINIARALGVKPYELFVEDRAEFKSYVSAKSSQTDKLADKKIELTEERIKIAIKAGKKLVSELNNILKKKTL